jgi:ubiquitin thioesterase protein OTUB1
MLQRARFYGRVPCREQQRERPVLGEKEQLDTLIPEYQHSGTVFVPKINSLIKQYSHFRRTRQDGNCFYRCFLFGLLENILTARNVTGAQKLVARIKWWKAKLVEVGYQELVFEDALDLFVEYLEELQRVSVRPSSWTA